MQDKTVVLTGATSGIGRATAVGIAALGPRLLLLGRDPARGEETLAAVAEATGRTDVELLLGDLSTLEGMRAAAEAVLARTERIDVLLNNAGITLTSRQLTADGFEKTFAVNHLAYFVLTGLLLPRLLAAAPGARIVSVASDAHRFGALDLDDLQSERYSGMRVYGKSKSANIHFTRELARRLEGTGVTATALHPGGVQSRLGVGNSRIGDLFHRLVQPLMKTPEQGAATSIYLATSPEVEGESGGYYANCRPHRLSAHCEDEETARRLWTISEELTGLSFP